MLKERLDSDLRRDLQEVYNSLKIKEMLDTSHYNHLANLFRYPMAEYLDQAKACAELLQKSHPEAYQLLLPFIDIIAAKSDVEIEELFGKTFHIQAICYLDLGYVLYAEDYKRGEFLVQMKNEQRKVKNEPIRFRSDIIISKSCRHLLKELLQKDYRKRISFDDFFNHEWFSIDWNKPIQ